jgi:hypothetical protein
MADEPIPQAPDPYADQQAIAARVKDKFDQWQKGREAFVYAAMGHILFYRGHQWWTFDSTTRTFNFRPKLPPGMPTPVANRFARLADAHVSMLARFEPSLSFAPGSHDAEDRAAADVASRAIDVIQDEVNMTTHRQALAKWVGLTGGAWRETGYDPDLAHGTVEVPLDTCPMCGAVDLPTQDFSCASCDGGPTIPALDPATGQPQTRPMPKGKMYVDACSLFEMFFDPSITDWSKQRAYLRQKAVDVEQAKARWKASIAEDSVKADSMALGTGTAMADGLPTLGPRSQDLPRQITASRPQNTKTTENYYYEMPTETYPDGLLAIFLGKKPEQFVKAGPLPYYFLDATGAKTYFLPHDFFPQNEVPGSAWPKSFADDIAPIQVERNKAHAKIIMWENRMANHVWLLPQGSNVRTLTGIFGQVVEYNTIVGGVAAKPERLAGQALTPGMLERLQQIDHEMDEIAIVSEVMSGRRPVGISAGVALQILKERGETQFGPMFIKWNHAEAQWAKKALAIARLYWTEERLQRIKGRDGQWEVKKFLGSDLAGSIDVIAEAGSMMPRSTMTERAEFEQAASLGVVNPAANPAERRAALKLFGLMWIQEGLEKEARNAIIENEEFEALAQALATEPPSTAMSLNQMVAQMQQMGAPPPAILAQVEMAMAKFGLPVPKLRNGIDDHATHADEHRNFAREQNFRKLPEPLQHLVELHIAAHDFYVGQSMMLAQQARQGTNPRAGFLQRPGPDRGSRPSTPSERGASSPQAMNGQYREMERQAAE